MIKAKDMSDSLDGKYSLADAKEEADRAKKTSIKVVSKICCFDSLFFFVFV
jgi:hypothetical protein